MENNFTSGTLKEVTRLASILRRSRDRDLFKESRRRFDGVKISVGARLAVFRDFDGRRLGSVIIEFNIKASVVF